ncbi:hypothetical protein [Amycolatopsis sp. YIM 10]|uniref:hypothetical protein n=1 Tax=Amycolatopsis sp. YIM 10 TaxID=2653857 RepID=UPI0012900E58|nr:hypothetical protein [Amycolatopsis sp. YIM 10]QFU91163.1 hypothetical protein YIM_29985 [Amycolatopsis sp. YIM 10]
MTVGEFRLQRQKNGRGYFGHVKVRVTPAATSSVTWAIPDGDPASLQTRADAEFVEAALAGVRDGLDLVRELGTTVDGHAVEVVQALAYLTDLDESAVHAAGVLAVAEAFDAQDRLTLTFDDGWHVTPLGRS